MIKLTHAQFEALVDQALAEVPDAFRPYLDNVAIVIESKPDRRTCREMDIADPRELLGLYHGTPLTERSVEASSMMPDRISVYKDNIEAACSTRDEVIAEIRTTVLHEIGHFFGLDEDELDELGYG